MTYYTPRTHTHTLAQSNFKIKADVNVCVGAYFLTAKHTRLMCDYAQGLFYVRIARSNRE